MAFNLFKSPQEKLQIRRRELLERMKEILRRIYSVLQIAESKQLDQAITYFKNNYPQEAKAKFANLLKTLEELRRIEMLKQDEERAIALDEFANEQHIQIVLLEHLEKAVKHIERGNLSYVNEAHELLDRLRKEVKKEAGEVEREAA